MMICPPVSDKISVTHPHPFVKCLKPMYHKQPLEGKLILKRPEDQEVSEDGRKQHCYDVPYVPYPHLPLQQ